MMLLTIWHIMIPIQTFRNCISLKWVKLVSLNPSSTMSISVKRQTPLVMTGNSLPWMILTNSDSTVIIPLDLDLCHVSLPPLDMMYIDDVPNLLDVPDVCNVIDVPDVTDTIDVTNILDSTSITDVTNISDDSHNLSSTSDISQVTTIREVLMVHHSVDME
jgi:hypothetical protein